MTEAQQNPQNETENTKAATTTGPRKRGPKPKNTTDNAAGNNTESKPQNEQQGTEQSSGSISSSQSELQSSNGAVGNHSPDPLNAKGEASNGDGAQSSVDQNKSNDNVNSGTENNLGLSPQDDGQGGEANQNQSSDSSDTTVNSGPENTPVQQTQNVQVNNNENIVVQETAKAEVNPKKGLIVKVKNVGLKAVYEPHSKISIEPDDEVTIIECANHADLKSVLANIDQLNALGKKIKVVNDE